jgi:hypothetical protein
MKTIEIRFKCLSYKQSKNDAQFDRQNWKPKGFNMENLIIVKGRYIENARRDLRIILEALSQIPNAKIEQDSPLDATVTIKCYDKEDKQDV